MSGSLDLDVVVKRAGSFELRAQLSVPPGTTSALLGPNGAGKSTAVAAIAGLVGIDSGRIALDGTVLDDAEAGVFVPATDRRIGVVFQDRLLFPHLDCLENIAFGLRSGGVGGDEARARAAGWMQRLGLAGLEHRRPGELSGGQAQRVALARALVIDPDLLLLDEPLSAVDVSTRIDLRHLLAEYLDGFAGPRLLITHDPTDAFLLADRIHILEAGVITQTGSADDIRIRPRTPYAADLGGSNLVIGMASDGRVVTDGHAILVADREAHGRVLVTIRPTSISLHTHRPDGSARNVWTTTVDRIEHLGPRVRLRTGAPIPLTVEITDRAVSEMGIAPGLGVWLAIKATEIQVEPFE